MLGGRSRFLSIAIGLGGAVIAAASGALAATVPLDLDGDGIKESSCSVAVSTAGPISVTNTLVNGTLGERFTIKWPSAGPAGLTASLPATSTAAPTKQVLWSWTTNQPMQDPFGSTCATDLCVGSGAFVSTPGSKFCSHACTEDGIALTLGWNKVSGSVSLNWATGQGPFVAYRSTSARGVDQTTNEMLGNTQPPPPPTTPPQPSTTTSPYIDAPPPGVTYFYRVRGVGCQRAKTCATNADCSVPGDGACLLRGPFGAPGLSVFSNQVTVTAETLITSVVTIFSPATEIFHAESTAGPGGVSETISNNSAATLVVKTQGLPAGCCPETGGPHQLNCDGTCVQYLTDPNNCGACGNACTPGETCSGGECTPCPPGLTRCGEACVDLNSDPDYCGSCTSFPCGEGACCNGGSCVTPCDPGFLLIGDQCVDPTSDNENCGTYGNVCGPGTCCVEGHCSNLLCDEDRVLCNGQCVDPRSDNTCCGPNRTACDPGACCTAGTCTYLCDKGLPDYCASRGECTDLDRDDSHCGGCDNPACGPGTCCTYGDCASLICASESETYCPDQDYCAKLSSDPSNCGTCGNVCAAGQCCSNGDCYDPEEGTCSPRPTDPGVCPNPYPATPEARFCPIGTPPVPGTCPNPTVSVPVPSRCSTTSRTPHAPVMSASHVPNIAANEAPYCTVQPTTTAIPPGTPVTTCTGGGVVFREVPTTLTVCASNTAGIDDCNSVNSNVITGTFNRLFADPSIDIGKAYLTPFAVHVVSDESGDGLLQPGESGSLMIDVVNAGPKPVTDVTATLDGPAVDLTNDSITNPVGITVRNTVPVDYAPIPGMPPPTPDCHAVPPVPASGLTPFVVTVPPDHPGDTSCPLSLTITGTVDGATKTFLVPLSLGIGSKCDYNLHGRVSDGVNGLLSPFAKLVPALDTPVFPSTSFARGTNLPFKMDLLCGGTRLGPTEVDPPEIVALTRDGVAVPVSTLIEGHANTTTTMFYWHNSGLRVPTPLPGDDDHWGYDLVTSRLDPGTYVMTVRTPGRRQYVTGFVLTSR